ncbi:MAG: DUF2752 domain-containing protein [Planctomycetota bacterium]|nr:DUF2752 domain-containing protein [Planctomycetota bacterium]
MLPDWPQRRRRAVDAAICFGILAASFLYAPYVHDGPVLCPLRLATGIPCPACGLTRSFCALAAGCPAEAFAEHLLGPPALACTGMLGLVWAYEAAAGHRVQRLRRFAFSRHAAWALAGVILAYHAVRMVQWGVSGELAAWIHASPCGRAAAWILSAVSG